MSYQWSIDVKGIFLHCTCFFFPFPFFLFITIDNCWTSSLYPADSIRVFLTLSPLAKSLPGGNIQQRQIEINWHGSSQAAIQPTDWIGLYEHDPTTNPTLPLRQTNVVGRNIGYFKTDVLFGFPAIDRQMINGQDACLGYWIGYIRNGVTIASNCLKIRPSWMWNNRSLVTIYRLLFIQYIP